MGAKLNRSKKVLVEKDVLLKELAAQIGKSFGDSMPVELIDCSLILRI